MNNLSRRRFSSRLDQTPEEDDENDGELTQTRWDIESILSLTKIVVSRISQLGRREQPVGANAVLTHSEIMVSFP